MLTTRTCAQAKEVWNNTWSCTNALDRDWVRKRLKENTHQCSSEESPPPQQAAAHIDCKLMFIELELTDPALIKQHVAAAKPAERQKLEALRNWCE